MRLPYNGTYAVTRPFGIVDPAYASYPNSAHPGTDYGTPEGTALVAAIAGKVTTYSRGNTTTGRGNEVVITNGSDQVKYCHLNRIDVANGATVSEGDPLGVAGWTGYVLPKSPDGSHLHFELLVGGTYVDFEQALNNEGEEMTEQESYAVTAEIYRGITDLDPEPGQADYWAKRIRKDPATAAELAKALYGDYKGDPMFRYKGRHYDDDMTAKYQEGLKDGGGATTVLQPGKYQVK